MRGFQKARGSCASAAAAPQPRRGPHRPGPTADLPRPALPAPRVGAPAARPLPGPASPGGGGGRRRAGRSSRARGCAADRAGEAVPARERRSGQVTPWQPPRGSPSDRPGPGPPGVAERSSRAGWRSSPRRYPRARGRACKIRFCLSRQQVSTEAAVTYTG